jgi:hypothetical protein
MPNHDQPETPTEIIELLGYDPLAEELIDDEQSEDPDAAGQIEYQITSYGADFPIDGLVRRLGDGAILIPHFQRSYVWSQTKASRFIESLLMGLPVPGVFFAREADTGCQLVIDGQQRLKTLEYFYAGVFADSGREFKLRGLGSRFEGATYKSLAAEDRRRLDDYTIHATIVKQDEPSEDDTSVYHIFERLNTGGMQLVPQEIRACIYHGEFIELLANLNETEAWREMYGTASKRMRDRELILRFFALFDSAASYSRPMKDFLNRYCAAKRHVADEEVRRLSKLFEETIRKIHDSFGRAAFRPKRALNAGVFDSMMFGIARSLAAAENELTDDKVRRGIEALLGDKDYLMACQSRTTDEHNVELRLSHAEDAFK